MIVLARCVVIILLFGVIAADDGHAASVRPAVWAGRFYPAHAEDLRQQIDALLVKAKSRPTLEHPVPHRVPRAIVLPHAGYVYSGLSAAHGLMALPEGGIDKVVLLGPDHRVGLTRAAVSDVDAYETPFGRIPLHADARKLLAETALFQTSAASDRMEHSLEVLLPYLQHRLGAFELVPVVVGRVSPVPMARSIEGLLDERTLLVVSSDLSHYLPYEAAVARDRETLEWVKTGNLAALMAGDNRACGSVPLAVLMTIAKARGWQPTVVHYNNSGDTAGSKDRVVGYAAIVYYGGSMMGHDTPPAPISLDPADGQALVALARQSIARKLEKETNPAVAAMLEEQLRRPVFDEPRGTFVTLKKQGQLRGCIGSLAARDPLKTDVATNAVNAAFRDPRFPPLNAEELDQIAIEVSVLSTPEPLPYASGENLLKILRRGVDGVIIKKGTRRATFLPQVWDQLPSHEAFLGHLCMKAGLPENAWRDGDLEVFTYQVTYFEESRDAP